MSLAELQQQYSEREAGLEMLRGTVSRSKEAVVRSVHSNLPDNLQQLDYPGDVQALEHRLELVRRIRSERMRIATLPDVAPLIGQDVSNQTRIRYQDLVAERLNVLSA